MGRPGRDLCFQKFSPFDVQYWLYDVHCFASAFSGNLKV